MYVDYFTFRYASVDIFKGNRYPDFCHGWGYVMSKDVLNDVAKLSYTFRLFPLEDVYVAMLVHDLGDVRAEPNGRYFRMGGGGHKVGCEMNNIFVQHGVIGILTQYSKSAKESIKIRHTCKL